MAIFYSCSLFFEFAILLYTKLEEVVYYYISTLLCHSSGCNVCLPFTFIFSHWFPFFWLIILCLIRQFRKCIKTHYHEHKNVKTALFKIFMVNADEYPMGKIIFQIINFWLCQSDLARTWAFQWGSLTCSTVEYYS